MVQLSQFKCLYFIGILVICTRNIKENVICIYVTCNSNPKRMGEKNAKKKSSFRVDEDMQLNHKSLLYFAFCVL